MSRAQSRTAPRSFPWRARTAWRRVQTRRRRHRQRKALHRAWRLQVFVSVFTLFSRALVDSSGQLCLCLCLSRALSRALSVSLSLSLSLSRFKRKWQRFLDDRYFLKSGMTRPDPTRPVAVTNMAAIGPQRPAAASAADDDGADDYAFGARALPRAARGGRAFEERPLGRSRGCCANQLRALAGLARPRWARMSSVATLVLGGLARPRWATQAHRFHQSSQRHARRAARHKGPNYHRGSVAKSWRRHPPPRVQAPRMSSGLCRQGPRRAAPAEGKQPPPTTTTTSPQLSSAAPPPSDASSKKNRLASAPRIGGAGATLRSHRAWTERLRACVRVCVGGAAPRRPVLTPPANVANGC